MACGCRGSKTAGAKTSFGTIVGWKLIFPKETGMESVTYSTPREAKEARRDSGIVGSTIEAVYR